MRITLLLSFLLFAIAVQGQPSAVDKKFPEKYLIDNADSLNPIEGIWNVDVASEYYHHDTLYSVVNSARPVKAAIIKVAGKFQSFDENGDPYEADFVQTDVKGVYLYRIFFPAIKRFSNTRAIIMKNGEMQYSFDWDEAGKVNAEARVVKILSWKKQTKK